MEKEAGVILIIHNVRSAYNIGSLFRTADGAGVSKIYLSGVSPFPIDRFGRARKDIAKVALGAEKTVPWEKVLWLPTRISSLKKDGYHVIALEQSPQSRDYRSIKPKGKFALIVGSETEGLPQSILRVCDEVIEIPMHGKKESLNVSVATGIALYELLAKEKIR